MSDRRVRPARPDEAERVRELGRAAWHAVYDDILGPETVDERIDNWWNADDLRSAITNPDHVFLVAEADGIVVGIVHAGPHPDGEQYVVPRLYVHPDDWCQGIGTTLLDELVNRVQGETDSLQVVVLEGNDVGVGFYESYGFEQVEEAAGLADAGQQELVYELRLEE